MEDDRLYPVKVRFGWKPLPRPKDGRKLADGCTFACTPATHHVLQDWYNYCTEHSRTNPLLTRDLLKYLVCATRRAGATEPDLREQLETHLRYHQENVDREATTLQDDNNNQDEDNDDPGNETENTNDEHKDITLSIDDLLALLDLDSNEALTR